MLASRHRSLAYLVGCIVLYCYWWPAVFAAAGARFLLCCTLQTFHHDQSHCVPDCCQPTPHPSVSRNSSERACSAWRAAPDAMVSPHPLFFLFWYTLRVASDRHSVSCFISFYLFLFILMFVAESTQLARQLHQERTQSGVQ